jgi:RNA polymerase sigma-70 factor, ECF subfamily
MLSRQNDVVLGSLAARDERDMILAICSGEKALFHELIRPYERMAYRMALSVLGNEADAEDATQEACTNAYLKLCSFRMESEFSTWLISIVLNQARSLLRRKKRIFTESLDASIADGLARSCDIPDNRSHPLDCLLRRELHARVHEALSNLPTTYRNVFRLRDMEGFSTRESAYLLGISEAAIKVRLHRARRLLRSQLASIYRSNASIGTQRAAWLSRTADNVWESLGS